MLGKRSRSVPASDAREPNAKSARLRNPPLPRPSPAEDAPLPVPLPLTHANLERLDTSNMPASPRRSGRSSPTKSLSSSAPSKSNLTDIVAKLDAFNVHFMRGTARPQELQDFVNNNILRKERSPISPNAKEIVRRQAAARMKSEQDGLNLLEKWLFYRSAIDDGETYVDVSSKTNLSRAYSAEASHPIATSSYGLLEQSQPDYLAGYVLRAIAATVQSQAPFTEQQEMAIRRLPPVCSPVHFPFFTCQWKSAWQGQSHPQAAPQCARDGATIVSSMYELYRQAYVPTEPSIVDTCHFSATADMQTIVIYVHWREVAADGAISYEMEPIKQAFLNDEDQVQSVRKVLRNILDHAVSERLASIKRAITAIEGQCQDNPPVATRPRSDAAPASASAVSGSQPHLVLDLLNLPHPPTSFSHATSASSQTSESPPRKRSRQDDLT